MSTGCWLYGLALAPPPAGLVGLDDAPVTGLDVGGIVAVVSEVPLDAWTGPQAEARLQDITALAPRMERHMAVQRAVHAATGFLPSRFGSLFSGSEAVAVTLTDPDLPDRIRAIGDREEWGVQAWASPLPEPQEEATEGGAAWLLRRRARDAARKQAEATRRRAVEALGADLEPRCVDAVVRPLPPVLDEEDPDTPLANWALLVGRGGGDRLAEVIATHQADLAARGVRIRLTGPWPPASFCAREAVRVG